MCGSNVGTEASLAAAAAAWEECSIGGVGSGNVAVAASLAAKEAA